MAVFLNFEFWGRQLLALGKLAILGFFAVYAIRVLAPVGVEALDYARDYQACSQWASRQAEPWIAPGFVSVCMDKMGWRDGEFERKAAKAIGRSDNSQSGALAVSDACSNNIRACTDDELDAMIAEGPSRP